jgi:hypothetical protein
MEYVKLKPRAAIYTEYARIFTMPFSRQQFDELLAYFYTERTVAEGRGENSTRSGRERRTERQVKPWTMASHSPEGVKDQLDKFLDAGEHEKALQIMRALRYFEKYPRAFGGPLPPWHSCLVETGDVIDVSMDIVDVEAAIFEVLLMKVIKAEPVAGAGAGATSMAPSLAATTLSGTKVRKRFPGHGWYDGEVSSADATAGKVEIKWHDGTTTQMSAADVAKYGSEQGDAPKSSRIAVKKEPPARKATLMDTGGEKKQKKAAPAEPILEAEAVVTEQSQPKQIDNTSLSQVLRYLTFRELMGCMAVQWHWQKRAASVNDAKCVYLCLWHHTPPRCWLGESMSVLGIFHDRKAALRTIIPAEEAKGILKEDDVFDCSLYQAEGYTSDQIRIQCKVKERLPGVFGDAIAPVGRKYPLLNGVYREDRYDNFDDKTGQGQRDIEELATISPVIYVVEIVNTDKETVANFEPLWRQWPLHPEQELPVTITKNKKTRGWGGEETADELTDRFHLRRGVKGTAGGMHVPREFIGGDEGHLFRIVQLKVPADVEMVWQCTFMCGDTGFDDHPSSTIFLNAEHANCHAKQELHEKLDGMVGSFDAFGNYNSCVSAHEMEDRETGSRLWHSERTQGDLFHGELGMQFPDDEFSSEPQEFRWTVSKLELDRAYPTRTRMNEFDDDKALESPDYYDNSESPDY